MVRSRGGGEKGLKVEAASVAVKLSVSVNQGPGVQGPRSRKQQAATRARTRTPLSNSSYLHRKRVLQ